MRRLVKRVGGKRASVPHGELVRFARDVGERVAVDFAAGREIGLSVVVLSPVHRAPLLERLSPRERTVARLITEGHRNESIAAELNIAVSTVKPRSACSPCCSSPPAARRRPTSAASARW